MINALLIPHASKFYSNICWQYTIPSELEKYEKVILICTNHYVSKEKFGQDGYLCLDNSLAMREIFQREHSYKWIRKEFLRRGHDIDNSFIISNSITPSQIQIFINKISSYDKQSTLMVFTSDLTHYTPQRHPTWEEENAQLIKRILESELIMALKTANINSGVKALGNISACGKGVLKVLLTFLKQNEEIWSYREVVCYYDSKEVAEENITNLPKIMAATTKVYESGKFVSYLGMIFGSSSGDRITKINEFNKNLALANVRETLEFHLAKKIKSPKKLEPLLLLPEWTYWRTSTNGAFVGISKQGNMNKQNIASMGRYESPGKSAAFNIYRSSFNCIQDALSGRLVGESYVLAPQNLDDYVFAINMLEEERLWKKIMLYKRTHIPYNLQDAKNGSGIVLHLDNDRYSALFLPSVWSDNEDWTISDLLDRLTKKAMRGVKESASWRSDSTAFVKIFKTHKFETWSR